MSKYRDIFSIFTNLLKKIKKLYFLFTLIRSLEICKKFFINKKFFIISLKKPLILKFEIIIKHIHFTH